MLCLFGTQHVQSFFDQLPPELSLFGAGHRGIADDVDDAIPQHDAIGSDHLRDRQCRGDLHGGDAGLFQFCRNRSTAARTGTSRGCQDNRVNLQPPRLLGDFATHAPRIRKRVG